MYWKFVSIAAVTNWEFFEKLLSNCGLSSECYRNLCEKSRRRKLTCFFVKNSKGLQLGIEVLKFSSFLIFMAFPVCFIIRGSRRETYPKRAIKALFHMPNSFFLTYFGVVTMKILSNRKDFTPKVIEFYFCEWSTKPCDKIITAIEVKCFHIYFESKQLPEDFKA